MENNILIMANQNMKVYIYMEVRTEEEKNMIDQVIYYIKVSIYMEREKKTKPIV